MAVSAATGTARLENDIDDWSSMLGHSGMRMGTVPRNATANATSVAMPSSERQRHVPPVGVADRLPELHRVADPAEQHRDRDERAHRHEELPRVHPVPLADLRRLHAEGARRRTAQLVERVALALVEDVARHPRQCARLQQRQRVRELVVVDVRDRDRDRHVGAGRR